MSRHPAARLWAGAFALSLLAHAGLGWALSMVPAGGRSSPVQTRFEIHAADPGKAARVAAHKLNPAAGNGVATAIPQPLVAASILQPMDEASTPRAELADRVTPAVTAIRPDVSPVGPVLPQEVAGEAEEHAVARTANSSAVATPAGDTAIGKARPAGSEPLQAASPARMANDIVASAADPQDAISRVREQASAVLPVARFQEVRALTPSPSGRQAPAVASSDAVAVRERTTDMPPTAPSTALVLSDQVERTSDASRIAAPRPEAVQPQPASIPAASTAPAPVRPAANSESMLAAMVPDEPELPEPREIARAELISVLTGENSGGCFLALASDTGGPPEVTGFAADAARLGRLERRLATAFGGAVQLLSHTIAAPQCATVAFAHETAPASEAGIAISLERPVIASGTELKGRLSGVTRPWLHLFVVDDDGIVHELVDLERMADGSIAFRAPLTLTDGRVGTAQLLLAVAADEPLDTPMLHPGSLGDTFFAELAAELGARRSRVEIGLVGFRVE